MMQVLCFSNLTANAQEDKNTKTGEIVMSAKELESLLTKIAERRKEVLMKTQALQLPIYQPVRPAMYQDPRAYQDLRSLEYKLDLLLSQSNLLPKTGGTTTINIPSQTSPLMAQPTAANLANSITAGTRQVLKGHQVFFANNSTAISTQDQQAIRGLIPMVKERENQILIVLKGYASQVGSAFYNSRLSFNRADAIKQILVSNGVSPGNIMILHHGADSTVGAEEARSVEITLELISNQ